MEAVNHGLDLPLAEGLYLEATLFGVCCATEDKNEGTQGVSGEAGGAVQGEIVVGGWWLVVSKVACLASGPPFLLVETVGVDCCEWANLREIALSFTFAKCLRVNVDHLQLWRRQKVFQRD